MFQKHQNDVGQENAFPLTSDLKTHERSFSWTGRFAAGDDGEQNERPGSGYSMQEESPDEEAE